MNNKQKVKEILKEIQKIRNKQQIISDRLSNYLNYQHFKITDDGYSFLWFGMCGKRKIDIVQSFNRAYETLSDLEKAQFYLMNVKMVGKVISNNSINIQNDNQTKTTLSQKTLKINIRAASIFKKFIQVTAQIVEKEKTLKINQYKIQLDLHHFLLRKSKKKQKTLVLEATEILPLGNTIWIGSSQWDVEDSLNVVTALWQQAQYDNIRDLITNDSSYKKFKDRKNKLLKPKSQILQFDSTMNDKQISSQQSPIKNENIQLTVINNYERSAFNFLQTIKTFSTFDKFQQIKYGTYYEKNGPRVRKTMQISYLLNERMDELLQKIQNDQTRPSLQIVYKLNNQKSIIKQVHKMGTDQIQFVYQQEKIEYHGSTFIVKKCVSYSETSPTLNEKHIIQANFQHCVWRIRETGNKTQIFVEAKIGYKKHDKNYNKAHSYSSLFIGEIEGMLPKKQMCVKMVEQKAQQIFQTVCNQQDEMFYSMSGDMFQNSDQDNQKHFNIKNQMEASNQIQFDVKQQQVKQVKYGKKQPKSQSKQCDFTKYKYIDGCEQKKQKVAIKSSKGHWLWEDEWEIRDNGDIVNINEQKIRAQSSVLKLIFKRLGRNIITGKSIMNVSLPVQIFGTDSNLERLARGFIFAPIFLQKAALQTDPVERIKYVICFGLGFSLWYIRMDKPFNPILGETYQGIVDGCPVYGEQTSHHPPISSLYMLGRGYKVYSSFEAKVQFGFNTAAGANDGFNHIEFQSDGAIVKISSPPGQLSGLIYGQRKVTVIKKTYCADLKNNIICELSWGRNKSSKDEFSKYVDFFQGKIKKVKSEIPISNLSDIKQAHVEKQYGIMRGRLTQGVYFNNELLFNVNTEQPHKMEDSPCLPSDTRHRKDVIYRKNNDLIKAQEAKQELQELQRRDRKLRQTHTQ